MGECKVCVRRGRVKCVSESTLGTVEVEVIALPTVEGITAFATCRAHMRR
jgi:hypothetical protein